jgi:hypothetical protein
VTAADTVFTAGDITWQLGKPASHLATRDEVLDHLRYCVDVARTKVDLEERFGWEYVAHAEADGIVTVTLRGPDGHSEALATKRLIKAYGNHVMPSATPDLEWPCIDHPGCQARSRSALRQQPSLIIAAARPPWTSPCCGGMSGASMVAGSTPCSASRDVL